MKKYVIFFVLLFYTNSICIADDVSSLVPQIKDAIFTVYAEDENHEIFASGSGFFISSNGIGITNFHVLQGSQYGHIKTCNGSEYKISHVIDYNPQYDLVKFKVVPIKEPFKFLPIQVSNLPQQGESVISYSNPLGSFENTVSTGIVSAVRKYQDYETVIQITAPISHGSSGSPVMNKKGEVIGIATFGVEEGQNLNFAVSVFQLIKLNRNLTLPVGNLQKNAWETKRVREAFRLGVRYNYDQALKLLDQEIDEFPQNHLAYYYRGWFKCRAIDFLAGMDDLLHACNLDTTEYDYFEKAANFLKNHAIELHDNDQQIPENLVNYIGGLYRVCVELKPNEPGAYADYGYFSLYKGKNSNDSQWIEFALALETKAIDLCPTPTFYVQRAEIYTKIGNMGAAILDCNKAINLDADYWRSYLIRGDIRCFELKQYNDGIVDLIIAESLAPSNHYKIDANGLLANAYCKKAFDENYNTRDFETALKYARNAYNYVSNTDFKANTYLKELISQIQQYIKFSSE